jgi:hypothetical protein
MPAASESRPASSLADLAECMVEQGNPGAAEPLQQRALALREKANREAYQARTVSLVSERLLAFAVI